MWSLINSALAAMTFPLLASCTFSQRGRIVMAHGVGAGLLLFAVHRLIRGVDLLDELVFYSKFHMEWHNVVIHVVFVPLIVWSAMVWLAYVPLPAKGRTYSFAHGYAALYSVFHIQCDPLLGSAAAVLWWAMAANANWLVRSREHAKPGASGKPRWPHGTCARLAGVVHLLSWYMQLHPGHKIYEGRKPALLDGMYQSFSVAPLFVFYEGAFAMGYRPVLQQQVHQAVAMAHAADQQQGKSPVPFLDSAPTST